LKRKKTFTAKGIDDWRLKRLTHTKPRRTQRKTIL
jgi:hypothetical protein